MKRKKARS